MQSNPQVPWTEEQWVRVNLAIQEEAQRARAAAKLLPLYGPLPTDSDFVRQVGDSPALPPDALTRPLTVDDRTIIELATVQVKLNLRGAQLADPEMGSVLSVFRRAANIIARVEDALVFNGQPGPNRLPPGAPLGAALSGGQHRAVSSTLGAVVGPNVRRRRYDWFPRSQPRWVISNPEGTSDPLRSRSDKSSLATRNCRTPTQSAGHPAGPDRSALGRRIAPSLLCHPAEPNGVVVALGGEPIELVIATDVSAQFLLLNDQPIYVFRVYEKLVLRIKSADAVVTLD